MIRRISPHLKEQIANEKILREQRLIIADYCCEQCGGHDILDLSHNKNKGMGGTHKVYTLNEVQILCRSCHNKKHHLREGNGKEESQTQPSSKN